MGVQRTGGFIGRRVVPSPLSAPGMWHMSEAESASRDSLWPLPAVSSPTAIAGLQLWLDASSADTLYDATSGGSLVAANGTVARWEDKSGNSRHFTQATSGFQPLRKTSVKNSLGAIEFANAFMTGSATYTIGSMFVVWNHPTAASDPYPAMVSQRAVSSGKTANGTINFNLGVPGSVVANANLDPNPGGTGSYRLNGSAAGSNFLAFTSGVPIRTSPDRWQYMAATFTATAGLKTFTLGADTFGATGRYMQNGNLGEVIAYSSALTLAQVLQVEGYLRVKWGL